MLTFLRQWTLRVASVALTWIYTLYRAHPAVWRLMAHNYRQWMGRFARLHAWMTCQFAWLEVPAYREHLRRNGWDFRWFRLASLVAVPGESRVDAGRRLQRTWLALGRHGLAVHPLSQLLDCPTTAARLADRVGAEPLAVFRAGRPRTEPVRSARLPAG